MAGINARAGAASPTPVRVAAGTATSNPLRRALVDATRVARADTHSARRTIRITLGTTVITVQHGLGRVPETVRLKRVLNGGPAPSYTVDNKTSRHLIINSTVATTVELEVW